MVGRGHSQHGRAIDWDDRWSVEAQRKQLPSLHGIVSKYACVPDVIGMHGGLPPADAFPFTAFSGRMCHDSQGNTAPQAAASDLQLDIDDPVLITAAQQYNMNAKGYAPLVSWAHDMVSTLHKPATLQPPPATSAATSNLGGSPVGMDVVITSGSSAALDSLVRMLLNPGDPILLEEYTYAHIVEAHLLPAQVELLAVQLDSGGLVPSHLDSLMIERQAAGLALPRVLYTIPTGQNPTGSVMSQERMAEVYSLAQKWDLVIIEDDAYYWLQYADGPDRVPGLNLRPGFLSLDVDGRVIRLDTLAKLLGPGYRLGWLAGPPALAAKFSLYTAGTSIGANMLSQVFMHQLLQRWDRSGFEAFVTRLQQKYARQAQIAVAAAAEHLAGLAEWQPVQAGMFMWCKLTGNGDSSNLVDAAAAEKVMVVPEAGEDEDEICSYFRVSFVSVGPEQLRQGFARLKLAIPNCQTEPKTPDAKDA
eukprot:gene10800-10956_t